MGKIISLEERRAKKISKEPIMNKQAKFVARAGSAGCIDLALPVIRQIKSGTLPRRDAASLGRFLVNYFAIEAGEMEEDACIILEFESEDEKKEKGGQKVCFASCSSCGDISGYLKVGVHKGIISRPLAVRIVKLLRKKGYFVPILS